MPLYGPRFPLSAGNSDTFEPYEDIKDQISFYLKNLILTSPGENISDPDYGVGLRRYLFEPNIGSTRSSISFNISRQISNYLPYLAIEDIQVFSSATDIDSNTLNIRIIYFLPGDEVENVFTLDLSEGSNIGFY